MNNILKCPSCNSPLSLTVSYSGCDWESEAGEGSGYKYPLMLDCTECPRVYDLGYLNSDRAFSPVAKYKPYVEASGFVVSSR